MEVVKLLLNVGGKELLLMKNKFGDTAMEYAESNHQLNQIINNGITAVDFNTIIKYDKLNLPQLI